MRWQLRFSVILAATVSCLSAQQAPVPEPSTQRLSVRTDFVLVPVIVTDKSGNPVAGLSKDAFRLEENGKLRSLSFFEETQTQKLTTFLKQSSSGSANFLPHDERLRLTVVVVDMVNTPWLRQLEGKKQLTDYLLRVTNQGEPIALFGLNSSGLRQLHPFSSDTKVLVPALEKLKLSLSSEESTQPPATLTDDPTIDGEATYEEQLMSDMLQDLNDVVAANYQRMATRQTLSAMTQFAHALGSTPGRKTLIWATAGFPFTIDDPNSFARQGDDLRPEYEEAWRSLNSANIAVYPVDLGSVDYTPKWTSQRQRDCLQDANQYHARNQRKWNALACQFALRPGRAATLDHACLRRCHGRARLYHHCRAGKMFCTSDRRLARLLSTRLLSRQRHATRLA